jgi:pilus assembly protein TadC
MKLDFKTVSLSTTFVGLVILYVNFTYVAPESQTFTMMNLATGVVVLGIPLLYRYRKFAKIKKIESTFPFFLRDITQNIKAGMTLPQAIRATTSTDYGILTPYVNDISAKISWGISFERILVDFASGVGSHSLMRTVQTIIEAHRSGGTMNTVLDAVAESLREIEKIKKERSASVYSQMINGYLIYIVFLGVMIGLSTFLIPTFEFDTTSSELPTLFPEMFMALIVMQGFFAGMAVGKMAEGTLLAGVKHALVLSIFGYTTFVLFG